MSAIIPGCDSDEEVFWGPVTARELEIIWRTRMANKKEGGSGNPVEKFIKKTETPKNLSSQNTDSKCSNNSVQEVPSLQNLRNSNDNENILCEENKDEHLTADSEHESIGNESTLPLLEASMIINQDYNKFQNFNFSSGDSSNNGKISSPIILNKHDEEHVKCVSESSNQLDHSVVNPELNRNIDLVHDEHIEEKVHSRVGNLNEVLQETKELHQDDVPMIRSDMPEAFCSGPMGEEIKNSDPLLTNFNINSSDDNNSEPQQVESIDVMDNMQPESVISKWDNIESMDLSTSEYQSEPDGCSALNQSNIENIPPAEINKNSVEHKEVLCDSDAEENIDPFRKTFASDHRLNGDNVLQEIKIENQNDSVNSNDVSKTNLTNEVADASINVASESSDEKSFVSMDSEEGNCISSSNSQYSSSNQDCPETLIVKNKENEEPSTIQACQDSSKSKIPISNHVKSTFLKPATLHHAPGTANEKWLNDLKRKKIPKPKKPDYIVSPAKLGSILKSCNQISANKPVDVKKSALPAVTSSTPRTIQSSTPRAIPSSTPRSIPSYTPKPIPGSSRTLTTPRKKQFEYVKSPISAYIRTGTGIPTAKSLPVLQSPNKIPVTVTVKQTPVQKLPPKFYSSAEKLVIKPGSSSVLKPAENRIFSTPKIFKHQGRVADSKKPEDINVIVTPRAVRKTNLTETSFACLPQSSKDLEVSVLEEI